ncbi:hypothetical protein V8G54_036058 [Vigna mungo]|uniref:Cathepsin propeptide inhibitor domain-containing protein n=1 Tax=Vigna mungo TaxID=3915 RepID=A0AAQ3MGF5_VIGMU
MAAHHRNKATRRTKKEVVSMYEKWIVEHGKSYNTPEEKDKRFQIFKNTLRYIDKANSANRGCTFGLNQFSDLTLKEFEATYLCNYRLLTRTRGKATGTSMAAHHRDKATERTEEEVVSLYEKWIVKHDRLYTPEEKDKRFQIFKDNMLLIDKEKTANRVPGPFADMTNEEFKALFSPLDPNEVIYDIPFF